MFGYGSDIAIVHGAFLSNATQDLPLTEAVDCIISQIKKYCTAHLNEGSLDKIHGRINSTLFVTLIKAECEDENLKMEFESVQDLFPNLNWEIYLHLLVELDWRPYFHKCLDLLDEFSLSYVSKQFLHYGCLGTGNFNSYLIHCLLQSMLSKPMTKDYLSCLETCIKVLDRYDFSVEFFTWSLDTVKCLSERMLNDVSRPLIYSRNSSNSTMEKSSSQNVIMNTVLLQYKELIFVLESIFGSCPSSLPNVKKVCECLLSLDSFVRCFAMFKSPTFESDEFDHMQIIKYKLEKMVGNETNENYLSVIKTTKTDLKSKYDLCKEPKLDEVLKNCATPERARECIDSLIENDRVRDSFQRLLLLMIDGPDSDEARKICLDSCCQDFVSMSYHDKMEVVLYTFGVKSELLQLKDYGKLLTTFLNQSIEGEFESKLLYLCLQSPEETVRRVVYHAISIGGQTSIYSKMLIFMSPLCNFSGIKGCKLLTEILVEYIMEYHMFEIKEKQNFISLVKELIGDESVFNSVDVIHQLLQMLNRKMDRQILETIFLIINEILETEIKRGKKFKSVIKAPKVVLVCVLCNLLTSSIIKRNGFLRERILLSMDNLKALCTSEDLKLTKAEMIWIHEKLGLGTSDLSIMAAAQFFDYDVKQYHDNTMRSYILCCCSKFPRQIKKFNQKDLITHFAKILTYITQQEWISVFEGLLLVWFQIEEYKNIQDVFELLKLNPTKKNKVLSLYIDALVLVGQSKNILPWIYMINAFTSMVQHFVLEIDLQLEEIYIAAGQIVYLVNNLCTHKEYLGKISQPLTNLLLHLINQCKNAESTDKMFLQQVFELVKDENIKNVTLANVKESSLVNA